MNKKILLAEDTIDSSDIDNLILWLQTYPKLTKGSKTIEFEEKWAAALGTKYSVFVNSGSSANLLMIYSMMEAGLLSPGDSVVVPALSWATDLSPVLQLNLRPILCDCNLEDLSIDLDKFEEICKKYSPKALILVSVLGLVPKMEAIIDICDRYGVHLLEDACESLGSKYRNKCLGQFGLMSSFSTYFGHHLSTIEGGVICTNDFRFYELLKSIRSHGWDRDLSAETQDKLRKTHEIDEFNSLYTFYYAGFNVRSTDLQAYIGIDQLKKLELISQTRNRNFNLYQDLNKNKWKPVVHHADDFVSSFAYPMLVDDDRDDIVRKLKKNNIEVRPLICGSMTLQPMYKTRGFNQEIPSDNAELVSRKGFYLPNHASLSDEDIHKIFEVIQK